MSRRSLESLGVLVKNKRGGRKLRETAKEIGIGPATLMRIESGNMPDIHTFGKVCRWLKVDPGELLGMKHQSQSTSTVKLAAHLRADQTPKPPTIQALAQMISLALEQQAGGKKALHGELR